MTTAVPGSYVLVLRLDDARVLTVGRLGTYDFPAGWYVYVGSALGGVEQRVARHLRPSAVRRWHLDYLRAEATVREAYLLPGRARRECELAGFVLSCPGASIAVPRFGASDCRCPSHLGYFASRPRLGPELQRLASSD